MSLNDEQRARTAEELQANLRLSGADPEEARRDLEFTTRQWDDTLNVREGARPQDVWLLRDHLEALAERAGAIPVPYTVLTRRARLAAALWFPLRKAPGRE
ncbi:DUF2316 family protein [Streptomyces albidoflavus]|uniref:DUF2316 family protein n=1 Tax=unclassified Streptomyces TaxID=2593676 RepID=UPI0020434D4F|nr:DUF2316 family protein [Streptomyces sp. DR3-1]MCM3820758.1 DUF2316 family protein [Streptomyces sp. DR3-1]